MEPWWSIYLCPINASQPAKVEAWKEARKSVCTCIKVCEDIMGSFSGHVLPGSFFILYGVAWIVLAMITHLKSKAGSSQAGKRIKRDHSVVNGVSFFDYKRDIGLSRKSWLPLPCSPLSRIPLEPIIKIVLPFIGILVEAFLSVIKDHQGKPHITGSVYHVYLSDGYLNHLDKLQHITMYGAFVLSGIVDILTILVKFPHQTSALFLALAFLTEGILFYFHTDGRDAINIQIHFILTLVIGICVLFAFLRTMYATNLLINLGLGFSIFLQGTWFIQVAHFLYPPGGKGIIINEMKRHHEGNGDDYDHHAAVMFIACSLTWHIMFITIGMLIVWVILLFFMRSSAGRRFLKKRGIVRLNPPQKWEDFTEKEKLISNIAAADSPGDGVANESEPVAVEMQQLVEVDTATL